MSRREFEKDRRVGGRGKRWFDWMTRGGRGKKHEQGTYKCRAEFKRTKGRKDLVGCWLRARGWGGGEV